MDSVKGTILVLSRVTLALAQTVAILVDHSRRPIIPTMTFKSSQV